MPNQQKDFRAVAKLARLDLTEGLCPDKARETIDLFERQFDAIIALVGSLSVVDTTNVEPLHWPLPAKAAAPREDAAVRHCTREEILSNAPDQDGDFFIVPRIV